MGRIFAIGDIHGCLTALQTLTGHLAFAPDDEVITLGDYVDRGPDSKAVIDCLIGMKKRTRLITLRGNHEGMMLTARNQGTNYTMAWLGAGGEATLASYHAKNWDDVPASHWEFLETTLPFHETSAHFFVHANVHPELPLAEQNEEDLYWERFRGDETPHISGKTMICGHSAQRSGHPLSIGHAVCIDTWVYGDGWLTCLDVTSGRYWQANQKGHLREAKL